MKIEHTCPICGAVFLAYARDKRVTCSYPCANELHSRRQMGKAPHNAIPENRVTYCCEQCSKEVVIPRSHAGRHRFCSKACYSKWMSENWVGANHPHYKGGTSFPTRGDNWSQQRKAALLRDGRRCCLCGRKPKQGEKYVIDVHHIKPFETFNGDYLAANDLLNLITLCRPCHFLVEKHGLACPQLLL